MHQIVPSLDDLRSAEGQTSGTSAERNFRKSADAVATVAGRVSAEPAVARSMSVPSPEQEGRLGHPPAEAALITAAALIDGRGTCAESATRRDGARNELIHLNSPRS